MATKNKMKRKLKNKQKRVLTEVSIRMVVTSDVTFEVLQYGRLSMKAWQSYTDVLRNAFSNAHIEFIGRQHGDKQHTFRFKKKVSLALWTGMVERFEEGLGVIATAHPVVFKLNDAGVRDGLEDEPPAKRVKLGRRTSAQAIAAGPQALEERIKAGLGADQACRELRALVATIDDVGACAAVATFLVSLFGSASEAPWSKKV